MRVAKSRSRNRVGPGARAALRRLPPMSVLLEHAEVRAAADRHGRSLVVALLRERLDHLRAAARRGALGPEAIGEAAAGLPAWVQVESAARAASALVPVINASGVVLHTNLGRAPLSAEAVRRIAEVGGRYSTLEYDIARGRRGSRAAHLDRVLGLLFPGRAFLVVNNNAAAVLLALDSLAAGREAIVSRGELVEIGGSFRVPEIMAKSGAILREVGTTNRTRLSDYERAIGPQTALILKVHPSNYRVVGFTSEVPLADLAVLARRKRLPLVMDQGSGNLTDLRPFGLSNEPTVQDALSAGADLVCCSGDKLLGGPQAGLLIGKPALLARIRRNPLARVLRPDKMILAGLEAVLRSYVRGTSAAEVPVLRMIRLGREAIEARARRLAGRVAGRAGGALTIAIVPGVSLTGGGSAPGEGMPTALLAVRSPSEGATALEERLRLRPVPVIARVEADAVLVDLRTVAEDEEPLLEEALVGLAAHPAPAPAGPPERAGRVRR